MKVHFRTRITNERVPLSLFFFCFFFLKSVFTPLLYLSLPIFYCCLYFVLFILFFFLRNMEEVYICTIIKNMQLSHTNNYILLHIISKKYLHYLNLTLRSRALTTTMFFNGG